jgi:hypothetical protein
MDGCHCACVQKNHTFTSFDLALTALAAKLAYRGGKGRGKPPDPRQKFVASEFAELLPRLGLSLAVDDPRV